MKKALLMSDIEKHRQLYGQGGFPDVWREYIILDGTREQLESWEPWQKMKQAHPDYIYGYINIDDTTSDVSHYDIVSYAKKTANPYPPPDFNYHMADYGGMPGDTAMIYYNSKEGIKSDIIIFYKGNIEQNPTWYTIEEPNIPIS